MMPKTFCGKWAGSRVRCDPKAAVFAAAVRLKVAEILADGLAQQSVAEFCDAIGSEGVNDLIGILITANKVISVEWGCPEEVAERFRGQVLGEIGNMVAGVALRARVVVEWGPAEKLAKSFLELLGDEIASMTGDLTGLR
jgi:hypothetical protein